MSHGDGVGEALKNRVRPNHFFLGSLTRFREEHLRTGGVEYAEDPLVVVQREPRDRRGYRRFVGTGGAWEESGSSGVRHRMTLRISRWSASVAALYV